MTKQNYIAPLVTTRKPTPEEWLANHERLHNEHLKRHLKRQQQVDLATDYVTNEELRGNK